MKRDEFLKKIALGMGVATVIPMALMAKNDPIEKDKTSMAIDVCALRGLTIGGEKLTPAEILRLWRQTGVLVYNSNNGNCPYLFNGKLEVVDVAKGN